MWMENWYDPPLSIHFPLPISALLSVVIALLVSETRRYGASSFGDDCDLDGCLCNQRPDRPENDDVIR